MDSIVEFGSWFEEQVAGLEVDDQLAWVWKIYLRFVPGLEEQVFR